MKPSDYWGTYIICLGGKEHYLHLCYQQYLSLVQWFLTGVLQNLACHDNGCIVFLLKTEILQYIIILYTSYYYNDVSKYIIFKNVLQTQKG